MDYTHLEKYFKEKKVFLTGHTGFKGSWMLSWLKVLGATVKGYSLAPIRQDSHYQLIEGDSICHSVIADILDYERLEKEIMDFNPDYVFHLAAQPLVRLSYDKPLETFSVNILGTANILNALKKVGSSCVALIITTDKVYDNKEWQYPYRENDRLGGYDPYSASKACAEIVVDAFRNSFFNIQTFEHHKKAISSVRAGNVIGGGDWAKDRIIPDIVNALSTKEPIVVRNPNAVRPWQHVLEPIGAYLHLATKMKDNPQKYSSSYNFGPIADDNLSVKEIVEHAIDIWGEGSYTTPLLSHQPHEAGLLKLDISKAIFELGWKPKYSAVNAIKLTIQWYKSALKVSPDILTQKQIDDFTS